MNKHGRIKRGDQVIIISGKYSGLRGEVVRVFPRTSKVIIGGINLVKKHRKPTKEAPGEIIKKEAPLHVSNVAICDPKTSKPSRIGFKFLDDGRKVRFTKVSGTILDN